MRSALGEECGSPGPCSGELKSGELAEVSRVDQEEWRRPKGASKEVGRDLETAGLQNPEIVWRKEGWPAPGCLCSKKAVSKTTNGFGPAEVSSDCINRVGILFSCALERRGQAIGNLSTTLKRRPGSPALPLPAVPFWNEGQPQPGLQVCPPAHSSALSVCFSWLMPAASGHWSDKVDLE